jgi:dienelactone hydrolase
MTFETIAIASGTTEFPGVLYSPSGSASTGLVVIAYGIDGLEDNERGPWNTMISGYANALVKNGLFALIPHYFAKTRTEPGVEAALIMMMKRNDWAAALLDSVRYAKTLSRVDPTRIGLLGFSLGGHLSLRIRADAKPRALVEYFAPMLDGIGETGNVPYAQIHHGTSDKMPQTNFSNADAIKAILKLERTAVTLFPYEGAGHGFATKDDANEKASALSQTRTLTFFQTHLRPAP